MRKLLISILLGLVTLFSFAPYWQAFAQSSSGTTGTWYNQDFNSWAGKVYDKNNPSDIFGERYTAAQVEWVIYGLFAFAISKTATGGDLALCLISNVDPTACANEAQTLGNQLKQIQSQEQKNQGYLEQKNQSLASEIFNSNRPLSGIAYVRNRLQKLSLVTPVQAQSAGFGYTTALLPIQPFWAATRNVAFSFFVLVTIVFAFLIMFRVKLNPQTVITVQSAIPKIILSLVAVTFSYAIAGFMVDFMYIIIGIISLAMSGITPGSLDPKAYFDLMTTGILHTGIWGFLGVFGIVFILPPIIIILVLGGVSAAMTASIGLFIALILVLIIGVIFVWMAIRTIWTLVKTLAIFLITVVFSPLTLVLGTFIPQFSFGSWIRTLLSQLGVFVTVGTLCSLSLVFGLQGFQILSQSQNTALNSILQIISSFPLFGPFMAAGAGIGATLATSGWPPLLLIGNGTSAAFIMWAVSFVLFTMIPKSAELIQSFIQGKPFAYGSAIGEALTPAPLRFGYRASGLPGALEILQSQRAYGALYNMAGTQDKPLYGLFKLANPKWDAAAQEIARRAGVDVDLH